ncbi:MAG: hypothetical protein AB9842_08295 [Bacteroidales bacterium]
MQSIKVQIGDKWIQLTELNPEVENPNIEEYNNIRKFLTMHTHIDFDKPASLLDHIVHVVENYQKEYVRNRSKLDVFVMEYEKKIYDLVAERNNLETRIATLQMIIDEKKEPNNSNAEEEIPSTPARGKLIVEESLPPVKRKFNNVAHSKICIDCDKEYKPTSSAQRRCPECGNAKNPPHKRKLRPGDFVVPEEFRQPKEGPISPF